MTEILVSTDEPRLSVRDALGLPTNTMDWKDAITAVRKTRLLSPRTLTIVGFAHLSRGLVRYDDLYHEVWGVNESYTANFMVTSEGKFRCDRWFQMHLEEDWGRVNNPNDPSHPAWLAAEHNFPIVMQEKFDVVPNAEAFPLDECDELFFRNAWAISLEGKIVPWLERYKHGYYSSSFVYMMAYALWQKETGLSDWKNIDIYGFHTSSQSEYMYQKPGAEFWISQAMARGINVRIVENSPMMHGALYGYEVGDALLPTALQSRIDDLNVELPALKEEAHQQHGARLMMDALKKEPGFVEKLPELLGIYKIRQQEELAATSKVNFYLAALDNSEQYMAHLTGRHEDGVGSGAIDRMTLEIQKGKVREAVVEVRAMMDAVAGALQECRLNQEKYQYDADMVSSFKLRETSLINKLIGTAGHLNNMLGTVSNVEFLIVTAEGRPPNFTDEHDFGYVILPDLFDPILDVLRLGEEIDGETRKEESETENSGGPSSSVGEPGESA